MSEETGGTKVFNASSLVGMAREQEDAKTEEEQDLGAAEDEKPDDMDLTTKHVPEETAPLFSLLAKLQEDTPSAFQTLLQAAADLGAHCVTSPTIIELTSEDKHSFADSVIDNKPWITTYSSMGGRVSGKMGSRTIAQTSAIMGEVQRRFREGELESGTAYSSALLRSFLFFQLHSLGQTKYPDAPNKEVDLMPKAVYDEVTGRMKVLPPLWYDEAMKVTGTFSDAAFRILINQLAIFECKYWELASMVNTEAFWNPED